jgi:uncharacterized protein YbjT (DUF2867 family)
MNKYVITGSIGHISKPIVEQLVKAGKQVTVITSNNDRVKAWRKGPCRSGSGYHFCQKCI